MCAPGSAIAGVAEQANSRAEASTRAMAPRIGRRARRVITDDHSRACRHLSDLQPGLLEIELAQDPVHRLIRELAFASHPQQRLALRAKHDLQCPLIGERLVLVPVVLDLAGAGREPALAVLVEPAQPLDR